MKTTNNPISPEYDTSINVIGGLQDISIIFKAIDAYFSESGTLNDLVRERNELNLRTERSRTRVHNAIKASFLVFKNEDHRSLVQDIFTRKDVLANKELIRTTAKVTFKLLAGCRDKPYIWNAYGIQKPVQPIPGGGERRFPITPQRQTKGQIVTFAVVR